MDFDNLKDVEECFANTVERNDNISDEIDVLGNAVRFFAKTLIKQQEQIDYLNSIPYSTKINPDGGE